MLEKYCDFLRCFEIVLMDYSVDGEVHCESINTQLDEITCDNSEAVEFTFISSTCDDDEMFRSHLESVERDYVEYLSECKKPKFSNVYDYGCGDGVLARRKVRVVLSDFDYSGDDYTGTDVFPVMVTQLGCDMLSFMYKLDFNAQSNTVTFVDGMCFSDSCWMNRQTMMEFVEQLNTALIFESLS